MGRRSGRGRGRRPTVFTSPVGGYDFDFASETTCKLDAFSFISGRRFDDDWSRSLAEW